MKKKFGCLVCLILILILTPTRTAGLSRIGSRGSEVTAIQEFLQRNGYDPGAADGIYGTKTKNAVMAFQREHGLATDGIAGEKTLAAMGISPAGSESANGDLSLLARLISAEARGESYLGQVAVGAVVLNRVKHPSFPDSLAGVVYQNGAFSCLSDGQFYEPVADSAYAAARDAMNGWDPTGGAIYYYNPVTATNTWIRSRPIVLSVGAHVFCR